jgi:hypothetical protein
MKTLNMFLNKLIFYPFTYLGTIILKIVYFIQILFINDRYLQKFGVK